MPTLMDGILGHRRSAAIAVMSALLWQGTFCYGARQTPGNVRQSDIVQRLASPNWFQRSKAVAALRSLPPNDWTTPVKDSLIKVFEMEEGRLRAKLEGRVPPSSFPEMRHEAFGEYYSSLAGLVMKLNDPRALPLIVNFPSSPDPRVLSYIAQRGREALSLVLTRLNRAGQHRDIGTEWTMLDALGELMLVNRAETLRQPLSESDLANIREAALPFLKDPSLWVVAHAARTLAIVGASQDQQRVQETFTRLLKDPDHNRREIALSAMRNITDPRFIPVDQLRQVAKHDAFRLSGPGAGYPAGAYPLRQQAEQILQGLRPAE